MSVEIKELVESVATDFSVFKAANDERLKSIEKRGFADPLLESAVSKNAEAILKMEERLEKIHAAVSRSGDSHSNSEKHDPLYKNAALGEQYRKSNLEYLRSGGDEAALKDIHRKALSVGSDPDGGYTITPETHGRIVQKRFESSPIRELATVENITSSSYELIADDDEAQALSAGELQARTTTNTPKLRKTEISVHEMYALPSASQKSLDDSTWDLEAWLGAKLADRFARKEATWFINGNGVDEARGVLTYAAGTSWGQVEQINSGSAAALTADGLIDLAGSLKEFYQGGAVYLMKRSAAVAVMKLKNTQNDYLWKQSLRDGQPQTLNGYPLRYADDCPVVAANALSVIFGNLKEAYTIVDRFGIRVVRDPFTARPSVTFFTTARVGGGVVNFEAVKIQKVAA